MIIKELAKEERPRERLMRFGSESLSNAELMAIIIGTGTKSLSAVDLGHRILAEGGGGLRTLAYMSVSELIGIEGLGEAKACRIVAGLELAKRISSLRNTDRIEISSPETAAAVFMEKMRYLKKEFFNVLLLDSKGNILKEENISVGDLRSSIVHPRESFAQAVKCGAAAVVFVHNHPSGDPTPSEEDLEVTKRLKDAGEILGIDVLDHIIIGDGIYVSLSDKGYI